MATIDLSHPIEDGMVTYPGLPGPHLEVHLTREASRERYAPGYEFEIGGITLVGNTGTYLDTPLHRFAGRWDLADLDIDAVAKVALFTRFCSARASRSSNACAALTSSLGAASRSPQCRPPFVASAPSRCVHSPPPADLAVARSRY